MDQSVVAELKEYGFVNNSENILTSDEVHELKHFINNLFSDKSIDINTSSNALVIEFLRACPFACNYCYRATGRTVRYKSHKKIIAEIKHTLHTFGKRNPYFYFNSGGTWPLGKQHGLDICNEIIKSNLKINWLTTTRVDTIDEELLACMKKAGCNHIAFGIESGDPEILRYSGKAQTVEGALRAIKLAHKMGMLTQTDFVLGLPFENRETIKNTYKLIKEVRQYSGIANFAILVPYPGTEAYEMALKGEGGIKIKTRDWTEYGKNAGNTIIHENFRRGELQRFQLKCFLAYYLFPPTRFIKYFDSYKLMNLFSVRRMFHLFSRVFN